MHDSIKAFVERVADEHGGQAGELTPFNTHVRTGRWTGGWLRQLLLTSTTKLVFLAAAAGTALVATDFQLAVR